MMIAWTPDLTITPKCQFLVFERSWVAANSEEAIKIDDDIRDLAIPIEQNVRDRTDVTVFRVVDSFSHQDLGRHICHFDPVVAFTLHLGGCKGPAVLGKGFNTDCSRCTARTEATNAPEAGLGQREMVMINRVDLEQMDNIGQIKEIVLSGDGQARALVIGVFGFLGMGEQDVDDRSQMFVILNGSPEMLRDAPAYDRMPATNPPATRWPENAFEPRRMM
ncbi:hypothetical protein GCM10011363_29010 [Marivita lacus]|uniref:PRC-barrel domain-containing protein n=2 Tax=Marivita lacus TaxID=1323742 RepID=A0ABQ1KX08_9RHOB|nr:hypothetical protein [Marivita lacus]GGC10517.1 hypothetical protein GCM10011363_29010 [Marivita lacus]